MAHPSRAVWAWGVIVALLAGGTGTVLAQAEQAPTPTPEMTIVEGTGVSSCSADICTGSYSMDDPRVSGASTFDFDYACGPTLSPCLIWGLATIANEGGAWNGQFVSFHDEAVVTDSMLWLAGTGGYAGLSYVSSGSGPLTDLQVRGLITSEPLPPNVMIGAADVVTHVDREPPVTPAQRAGGSEAPSDGSPVPGVATSERTGGEATIVDVERLDDRTVDLTIDSPSVGVVKTRLLLPAGFDEEAAARWPVLYLLHGAEDDYTSWTRETAVAALTADTDLLVVMPEAGRHGYYSDWWNAGEGGPPMWETFHLVELRELLERDWQAGPDRVVAGLSMGGLGAMTYAARHPDFFQAAASFSGVLHPLDPGFPPVDPTLWGDKDAEADVWEAHDPVSLAPGLAGTPLYVSYGTGDYGPLDDTQDPDAAGVEAWLAGHNEAFVARLEELGIPVTVDVGPGTHSWPYWEQGLQRALPLLLHAIEG